MRDDEFDEPIDDFYVISNQLRKQTRSMYNRLRSIQDDSQFIRRVSAQLPQYPVLANQRCGLWYVPPEISSAQSVYFKSTDGHNRNWKFSLRRANTHLFDILQVYNGCIIVDSTRQGKTMPDSFSKTIPIWCAVWNLFRSVGKGEVDVPGNIVSASEKSQMELLVPGFVRQLESAGIDFKKMVGGLKGVLKPVWVTRDCNIEELGGLGTGGTIPVICVCASASVGSGRRVEASFGSDSYLYVQGAADDHELWAQGLTPRLFWKHQHKLLADIDNCEQLAGELVAKQSSDVEGSGYNFVGSTNIAVGGRTSGRPPECWQMFDAVINCGAPEYQDNRDEALKSKYLYLDIPEGKRGQVELGKSIEGAMVFAKRFVENPGMRLLVHCSQGMDRSVGISLAILAKYFGDQGGYEEQEPSDIQGNHQDASFMDNHVENQGQSFKSNIEASKPVLSLVIINKLFSYSDQGYARDA